MDDLSEFKYFINGSSNRIIYTLNIPDIISLCKTKNQQAEKELFLRFAPKVMTICRRYASQNVEAQDFMQECFIHVFAKIDHFDAQKGSFEGWLHRVCTNIVLQQLRKSKREITMVFPEELPEQELTEIEFKSIPREVILNAIQKLPDGYRKVLNLTIFEGWSHQEIGQALEIAPATSRSQLARAKKMLKNILQKKIARNYERRLAR